MLRVSVKRARKSKNKRFRDASMKCTVYIEKAPFNRKETWQARETESRCSWQLQAVSVDCIFRCQNKTKVVQTVIQIVISTIYQYIFIYKQDWSNIINRHKKNVRAVQWWGENKLKIVTISSNSKVVLSKEETEVKNLRRQ